MTLSGQELDLRRSWRALRRRRRVLAAGALAGVIGGALLGALFPPQYAATSLIVLPPPRATTSETAPTTHSIETHVLVARSGPVLASAGENLDPPLDVDEVRDRVEVTAVTSDVLEIEGRDTSATRAIALTNAVAEIYLVFATTEQNLPDDLGIRSGARVLQQATSAHGGSPVLHYGLFGGVGAVLGTLLGAVGVLIAARRDKRLHLRDEIANSVGIPVLASVSSYYWARGVSGLNGLLEQYRPSAVDSWSFRRLLRSMGVDLSQDDDTRARRAASIAVITFSDDEKALALAPQLAVYAQAAGIPTTLIVDPAVAAANALVAKPHTDLAVVTGKMPARNGNGHSESGGVALRISMIVVDRSDPNLAEVRRSRKTVVGLSSGAVTAEDLARLAVLAAADRREIHGLVVLDPDPTDRTTGLVPQPVPSGKSKASGNLADSARRAAP